MVPCVLHTQTTTIARQVKVDDISNSVILIGRLGKPLGTKVAIRGTWSFPTEVVKAFSPRFTVHHISDTKLNIPIEFNINQLRVMTPNHQNAIPPREEQKSLNGQEWELIACETGYIQLCPDEYSDHLPVFPIIGLPYYSRPFTSRLVAVATSIDGQTISIKD